MLEKDVIYANLPEVLIYAYKKNKYSEVCYLSILQTVFKNLPWVKL